MDNLWLVLVVMVLIESIVETIKPMYDKEKGWNRDALIALAISEVVCVLVGIDLFRFVGAPLILPLVDPTTGGVAGRIIGSVLTGVIGSRGANAVHDILKKLNALASGITPSTGMTAGKK